MLERQRAGAARPLLVAVAGARARRLAFAEPARVRRAQGERIGAIVAYARDHVPYYRETLRRLLLGPSDLATAADLARLPLLEREQIQRDPDYFRSERWPAEACVVTRTSGTTGAPTPIFTNPGAHLEHAACRERLRSTVARLLGSRWGYREALVVPPSGSVALQRDALAAQLRMPVKRVRQRLYSMALAPAALLEELESDPPEVLTSYGSYLEELFVHVRRHPGEHRLPRVALYHSDALSPAVPEWVRAELGIETLSTYKAAETPPIGFGCERQLGYHLNLDYCAVRLLGADGREPAAGEEGEVVVSNLVNRATVLLNYRLGDRVALTGEPCPCGRTLPLCSFLGRTKAAWLEIGDGHKVHARMLRSVLDGETEVWRLQIVQESARRFLYRLVVDPGADRDGIAARVSSRLSRLPGPPLAACVEFVDELLRSPSGKVQPVVALSPSAELGVDP